jgi:hypothetical protein
MLKKLEKPYLDSHSLRPKKLHPGKPPTKENPSHPEKSF